MHDQDEMTPSRRSMLAVLAGVGAGAGLTATSALAQGRQQRVPRAPAGGSGEAIVLAPEGTADQSARLQAAIDQAVARRVPLVLAAGRFPVRRLTLRAGLVLSGMMGATRLDVIAGGDGLVGERTDGLRLSNFAVTGAAIAHAAGSRAALVTLRDAGNVSLDGLDLMAAPANGLLLEKVAGRISGLRIAGAGQAGIFSLDGQGLAITGCTLSDCANNGILVWTSRPMEDGTLVAENRVRRIRATAGGTGQNGNGINVYRAGSVTVVNNHITDCAYSAVRGNAASNIQIIANQAARIGEVALYAEFGFQGAVIAHNIVDGAATGISVTNFNEGGRLAVVQGNLIRNLVRREHEPEDKRGEGIAVEADASVTGNVIETAATIGIMIGWGRNMRNVAATGNVIRAARIGIGISGDVDAGAALIASNLITDAPGGGIRTMRHATAYGPELGQPQVPGRANVGASRITVSGNAVS